MDGLDLGFLPCNRSGRVPGNCVDNVPERIIPHWRYRCFPQIEFGRWAVHDDYGGFDLSLRA